eukprot:10894058-Alexandrium_andersonii.AAC.1
MQQPLQPRSVQRPPPPSACHSRAHRLPPRQRRTASPRHSPWSSALSARGGSVSTRGGAP